MVGSHKLIVRTRKHEYDITIKYKFNIIRGDSGTGKSLLEKLVYDVNVKNVGNIKIISDLKPYSVREFSSLVSCIESGYNLIIIDEVYFKAMTKGDNGASLAKELKDKPIYCIIISRETGKTAIPVDINACYALVCEDKGTRKVSINKICYNFDKENKLKPDVVLVEDSSVGYTFYKETLNTSNVVSLHGTGGIVKIEKYTKRYIKDNCICFLIVDGCAMGFLAKIVLNEKETLLRRNVIMRIIIFPSFEWLVMMTLPILKANKSFLTDTYKYCKIEKYMSYEKYYSDYLSKLTNGGISKNSASLRKLLTDNRNIKRLYDFIEEIDY